MYIPELAECTMIPIVVDMFTTMEHLIPIPKQICTMVPTAYLVNVSKFHHFPEEVVLDQDSTFTRQYFRDLYDFLGIKGIMSMANHSHSERQIQGLNQVIKVHNRAYCKYQLNQKAEILSVAEYVYHNLKDSWMKMSVFYFNYGFKLRTNWPTEISYKHPESEMYVHDMTGVFAILSKPLAEIGEKMGTYINKKWKAITTFKKMDWVVLNGKNIQTRGICNKLDETIYGQFEVLWLGKNKRYWKFKLPESWKIHPTFNVSLLEPYEENDPESEALEVEADHAGWRMERIIASGLWDINNATHLDLVTCEGYLHQDSMWQTYANVPEHAVELWKDY